MRFQGKRLGMMEYEMRYATSMMPEYNGLYTALDPLKTPNRQTGPME